MKKLIVMMLIAGSWAKAQDANEVNEFFLVNQEKVPKIEAVRKLLQNDATQVFRCVAQELTPKVTLKNKKKR
jgi:hypothetical protein